MFNKPLSVIAGITVLGSAAPAEVINEGRIGLADPVSTITFDEIGVADDTRISAEFAHLGVTFLPELYYRTGDNPDWDNITGPNLRSGNLAGNILHQTFSLSFEPPRSSAAFVAIAQPPTPTTFTAKLNGVEVESFDTNVVIGNVSDFFGFTDIVFDEIEVSYTADTRMRIDNLQLGTAVATDGPRLDVTESGPDLVFSWESKDGMLYNLRSETDPSATDPPGWPILDGHENLEATPPENTLTIPRPPDSRRFFVIEQFPAPPVSIFSDDFESGQGGWTFGSDGAAGTAWELGVPTNGPGTANSLVNCFGTNLTSDYGINADVWLRSPAIDLTTAGGATLNYFQYRDIEEGFDFGIISVLDAADDSLIAEIPGIDSGAFAWELVSKSIPAEALGKMIKIEFRMTSDEIETFPGLFIDDFEVTVP